MNTIPTYEEILAENEVAEQDARTGLLAEVETMDVTDLLNYLTPPTLQAIRADLDARPPLTPEELAYFNAGHSLTCAIQKATKAATKALATWESFDLYFAERAFEVASVRAGLLTDATARMDAAFKLTDEYREQQLEKGKE